MKFDFVIGNPPYQDETLGDNKTYAPPVYNLFLDEAYKVANVVEMVHPARFLFNAGSTPKAWNQKMLSDPHFKVLQYEPNSSSIFANTSIKGGIAITYRNTSKKCGAIETFTPYPELNSILIKIKRKMNQALDSIISGRGVYRLSLQALTDFPEIESIQSKGHKTDIGSGAFKLLSSTVFHDTIPNDTKNYVPFLGLAKLKRTYYWIEEKYINPPESFYHYKVIIPQANGSGALGETIASPLVEKPHVGATETFLSVGSFDTEYEANACLKYIKSKFARALLSILKITQANTREKWKFVPLQDFTPDSDIDWSGSVAEIDRQLYRKYNLSDDEIAFIETKVKEMI